MEMDIEFSDGDWLCCDVFNTIADALESQPHYIRRGLRLCVWRIPVQGAPLFMLFAFPSRFDCTPLNAVMVMDWEGGAVELTASQIDYRR